MPNPSLRPTLSSQFYTMHDALDIGLAEPTGANPAVNRTPNRRGSLFIWLRARRRLLPRYVRRLTRLA